MIKITVPATSANLGIGYDTLGMAVSLYAHVTMDSATELTITGCPEAFRNADNMVYQAFLYALETWGEKPFPVSIHIETEVPVARGLGSSSTLVVAGIMGAAALTNHTVTRATLHTLRQMRDLAKAQGATRIDYFFLVPVGREGPVAFHVLTGKDAAAGQGRRDGKGHHRLADAGRTGKNHGVRQAVLFHQADQPLLDGAVADNILKIQLVHGLLLSPEKSS